MNLNYYQTDIIKDKNAIVIKISKQKKTTCFLFEFERMCTRGGLNYGEPFIHLVGLEGVRILLAYVAYKEYKVYKMNLQNLIF